VALDEQVENVLGTVSRPPDEKAVVAIVERAAAPKGHEPAISMP